MFAVPTYAFLVSIFVMIGVGVYKATVGGGLHHVPMADPTCPQGHGCGGDLPAAPRLRLGRRGHDRRRGDLQRRARVQEAGVEERPVHPDGHGRVPRRHVHRDLVAGDEDAGRPERQEDGHLPDREGRLRERHRRATSLFLLVQATTMLILVLAANTSFADFPRLASFHADDHFMPKQLTKRGHRLVFSNGIVALAIAGAGARRAVPGRRHPPHPALRHRRVHLASPCRRRACRSGTSGSRRRDGGSASPSTPPARS